MNPTQTIAQIRQLLAQLEAELSPDDGWIAHDGSAKCPVPDGTRTRVLMKSGTEYEYDDPEGWRWKHNGTSHDITHYRVVKTA